MSDTKDKDFSKLLLENDIIKFSFQEKIEISNNASNTTYSVNWNDDDNKRLWEFIFQKLWIEFKEVWLQEDVKGVDALFKINNEFLPFDFKTWLSDNVVLYIREFIKDIKRKGIFYFKKEKWNDWKIYLLNHFYYISWNVFEKIHNNVQFIKEKIDCTQTFASFMEKWWDTLINNIESWIKKSFNIWWENTIFISLEKPEKSSDKYSRYNKAISNSIRIQLSLKNNKEENI